MHNHTYIDLSSSVKSLGIHLRAISKRYTEDINQHVFYIYKDGIPTWSPRGQWVNNSLAIMNSQQTDGIVGSLLGGQKHTDHCPDVIKR